VVDAYYREFGRRVRDARRDHMTQQVIARKVGLSRAAVANIELGRQRVALHMIVRFARALGVSQATLLPPGELLGNDEDAELGRLSPGDQAAIQDVISSLTAESVRASR